MGVGQVVLGDAEDKCKPPYVLCSEAWQMPRFAPRSYSVPSNPYPRGEFPLLQVVLDEPDLKPPAPMILIFFR